MVSKDHQDLSFLFLNIFVRGMGKKKKGGGGVGGYAKRIDHIWSKKFLIIGLSYVF